MKKNFYPYKRIKNAIYGTIYGIILSLVVGLTGVMIMGHYFPNKPWIAFIVLFGSFVVISLLIFFICKVIVKREAKKHKKFIKFAVVEKNLTELFEKNQPIEVNDKSFVYIYHEKMFNTISVYHLNEQTTFKDLKPLRKVVSNFLKDNYEVARVTVNHKRHHELKVQLYVTDKFNEEILVHLTDGGEQMNDIGFLRCYWCVDTQSVWLPFYKGEYMEFHAAKNYHNAYTKLLNLFECIAVNEEDYDGKVKQLKKAVC